MPSDSFRIMCPKLTCRRILAVPTTARGKTVRCRNCGTNIRVPMMSSEMVGESDTMPSKKKIKDKDKKKKAG